jgi:hypothetical protein
MLVVGHGRCYALSRMRGGSGAAPFLPVGRVRGGAALVEAGSGRFPGEGRD